MSPAGFAALTERVKANVAGYMNEYPLRFGIAPDELRNRSQLARSVFEVALLRWCADETLEQRGRAHYVARPRAATDRPPATGC